jgi:broad specificity phosphatase PhoE
MGRMRSLELRRHAARDPEADALSPDGQVQAEEVGRGLPVDYAVAFVSPARRAAETLAWFLRGSGQQLPEHAVIEGLASPREDAWRAAGRATGTSRLDALMAQDPGLVEEESRRLAGEIRALLDLVPESRRGIAVGHSPLIEAAVFGLLGMVIEPLSECEGVLLTREEGQEARLEEIRR